MSIEKSRQATRRHFLKSGLGIAAIQAIGVEKSMAIDGGKDDAPSGEMEFWPEGRRLIISVSMQFEAGGEPDFGVESPFSGKPLPEKYPDLPAKTWFQYGYREGIPRLLDLWDEFGIKVTSHMVGAAVEKNPQIAKMIVDRGHEAAAHGMAWDDQYDMSYEEEKAFVEAGVKAVFEATGQRPLGYNCNWLRRSANTLKILQELGFIYHIDDLSRDEPFVIPVNNKPFVVVPYTLRCNDIALIEGRHFSTEQFFLQLKDEFDQLYLESSKRRVMMSISTHDRIGGTPGVVNALRRFFEHVKTHQGVGYERKDRIAKWAMSSKMTKKENQAT